MNATSNQKPCPADNKVSATGFSSSGSTPLLVPGPTWNTFEDFRKLGNSALETIQPRGVATLNGKAGCFRVLRESDFQYLLGLASDVGRLQNGMSFIFKAANVARMHPDKESIDLLIHSFSLVTQSPEPPQREGHQSFRLTPEEVLEESSGERFDFAAGEIPRPPVVALYDLERELSSLSHGEQALDKVQAFCAGLKKYSGSYEPLEYNQRHRPKTHSA